MSLVVQGIDHVEVFVRDIRTAIDWYEKVLGLKIIHRWEPEPVMIGMGTTKLALFQADTSAKPGAADEAGSTLRWHRVAWRIDPNRFQNAQLLLKDLGIRFRGPIDHGVAQSIYFADLDGHPLEITCYHSESSHHP